MTIQEKIIQIIRDGKLTQGEIATACGLSRVTINCFVRGKKASMFREAEATRLLKTLSALTTLIEKRKLPLADGKTKEQRTAAMEKVRAFVSSQ